MTRDMKYILDLLKVGTVVWKSSYHKNQEIFFFVYGDYTYEGAKNKQTGAGYIRKRLKSEYVPKKEVGFKTDRELIDFVLAEIGAA